MSGRRTKEAAVDWLTGRPIREHTIEVRDANDLMASDGPIAEAELVVEAEDTPTTAMTLARWQEPQPPPPETPPARPTRPAPSHPEEPPPEVFTATYYRPPPAGASQRAAVGLALGALVGGVAAAFFGSQSESGESPHASPPPRGPVPRHDRPPPVRPRPSPSPPRSPELARLFAGEDDRRND